MSGSSCENINIRKKRDQELKNKVKNMSKEALALALSKKKECNTRAMHIVEQSIEPGVSELWLLENLKHINQSHFQDIVEERAITRICGYPLCVEELSNVPKKIYKISTRENKVYDITDRKNYCSNNCYKAGTFLKDQLFTSPLWLRDCEKPVEYQLLSSFIERKGSGSGAEIDLGNTKPVKLDKKIAQFEDASQNIGNDLTSCSSDTKSYKDSDKVSSILVCMDASKNFDSIKTSNESGNILSSKTSCASIPVCDTSEEKVDYVKANDPSLASPKAVIEGGGETSNENLNRLIPKKAKRFKETTVTKSEDIISGIEQRIESWFTVESIFYLLGQEKVKELLKINGYSEEISPKKDDYSFYLKCQEIYKKLNILELKEGQNKEIPSKPVPDYDSLRKENEELELKVNSFFRGDAKVTFADDVNFKEDDLKEEDSPVLPLIDHCAIMASRRRIFMDRLKKVLPDMLSALDLSEYRLSWEIQELVTTFDLGPKNISMRPPEWTLVAIIIIKLLTLRNEILNFSYSRELTQKRLSAYLLTYDLDGGYPDRFTSHLLDIERIASRYRN